MSLSQQQHNGLSFFQPRRLAVLFFVLFAVPLFSPEHAQGVRGEVMQRRYP